MPSQEQLEKLVQELEPKIMQEILNNKMESYNDKKLREASEFALIGIYSILDKENYVIPYFRHNEDELRRLDKQYRLYLNLFDGFSHQLYWLAMSGVGKCLKLTN